MYCPKQLLFNLFLGAVAQENPRQVSLDRYDSVFFHFCLARSYLVLCNAFWSLWAPISSRSPNWLFYQELLWSWEPGWARGREAGLERMKVKRKRPRSLRNRQLELLNAPFIPLIQWDIAATKGEVLIIFGSKLVSPCFVFDFYFINSSVNYSPWLKFIKTPSPGAAEAGGSWVWDQPGFLFKKQYRTK